VQVGHRVGEDRVDVVGKRLTAQIERDVRAPDLLKVAPLTLAMLADCAFSVSDLKTGIEKSE
jgi:hypothetical protein